MTTVSRPTSFTIDWATDAGAVKSQPPIGARQTGWAEADYPPVDWFNYWQNGVYKWVEWLAAITDSDIRYVVAASNSDDIYKQQAYAICDGTDDQTEINAAITAVEAAGGGVVHLKPGTYTLNGSIVLPTGVRLVGAGRTKTIIKVKDDADSFEVIANKVITGAGDEYLAIIGMSINGNSGNQTDPAKRHTGIALYDTRFVSIVDVYAYNFQKGSGGELGDALFMDSARFTVVKDVEFTGAGNLCLKMIGGADCAYNSFYDVRLLENSASIDGDYNEFYNLIIAQDGKLLVRGDHNDFYSFRSNIITTIDAVEINEGNYNNFYSPKLYNQDTGIVGFELIKSKHNRILYAYIEEGYMGIREDADCEENIFENCYIINTQREGVYSQGARSQILRNRVKAASQESDGAYDGIYTNGDGVILVRNRVHGGDGTERVRNGFYHTTGVLAHIEGNYAYGCRGEGVFISSAYRPFVNNNFTELNENQGLYVSGCEHAKIINNISSTNSQAVDNADDNIRIKDCDEAIVTGNQAFNTGVGNEARYGINIESSGATYKLYMHGNMALDGGKTLNINVGSNCHVYGMPMGKEIGASDTQFDITIAGVGNTMVYTYDTNGTDPNINKGTVSVGDYVEFQAQNFNAANNGVFIVTGVMANDIEIDNAWGVAETNKTIGTGFIRVNFKAWQMCNIY